MPESRLPSSIPVRVSAPSRRRTAWEVLRFGLAGLLNAGVGYMIYAGFIFLGVPMFVAQALGHTLGTCFNYVSHSRFVFQQRPSLGRYLLASTGNYLAGLLLLALCAHWMSSPYLAGLVATGLTAVFSYLSLKLYAFHRAPPQG